MNKLDFDNPIRQQTFSLTDLVEAQLEGCFGPGLKELMSMAEIFDARKIILTGCGDSYGAAIAMAPVIAKYCDCFGVQAMRTVEFTRFLSKADIGIGEPNMPLVIAISAGGGTARICEALEKANQVGAFSILLTNNGRVPRRKGGKAGLCGGHPPFPNDHPGLRSYFGSLVGLIAFASRMGHVRGTLPPTGPAQFKKAITDYVKSYEGVMERIDDQMFALAQRWQAFERFDFIGDDVEYGSAFSGRPSSSSATAAPCRWTTRRTGATSTTSSRTPRPSGTVFMADRHAPSFGRVVESANSARRIGRPVLVVTNADAKLFDEGVEVCRLPDTPAGYEWLMPLMDYAPASILAGYVTTLKGEPFFRRALLPDGTPDRRTPLPTASATP